uniref:SWI/SNF-related matrix-associated actin-dependent regulator of chromatin subfamily A-like protein 1 (Trinotate prediction) n=1 Tax=Henneguya salminicola TaxID=69463 RepID=A0A6G3MEF5_HENSL
MPTKIYDKKDKSWSFDISDYFNLLASLKKNPILLIEEISPYIINTFLQDRKKSVAIQTDFNIEIDEKIKKALYPYQVDCLKKAIQNEGRLLIADEMGLGKTLQALAIASYYRSEWPFLIVCTASLKLSWLKSVNDWFSTIKTHDVTVISTVEILPQKLIYIISYNMLNRVYKTIKNMNFKIIIAVCKKN